MSDLDDLGIFPDDITSEILTYLPAKTITRCKCVSKRWNAIICNPKFIISYISKSSLEWVIFDRSIRVSPDSEPDFKVRIKQPPNVSTLSINPSKLGDHVKQSMFTDHKFPVTLMNSSNGFILFSIMVKKGAAFSWPNFEDSLYVVNPITREWVPIPKPPHNVKNPTSVGFATEVGPTGVLERFVIVDFVPDVGSKTATLICFSSESWKWEEIPANCALRIHTWSGNGGVLEFDGHLLCFDPRVGIITWDEPFAGGKKEVGCGFIALPRPTLGSMDNRGVGVGGGHIQCLEGGNQEMRLWRLKEYKGGEWSLVHKLCFRDLLSDFLRHGLVGGRLQPLFMHPYESEIVLIMEGNNVICVDVGTKKVVSCGRTNSSSSEDTFLGAVKLPSWPTVFSPRLKATFLKEHGNEFFKAKNFDEAINCYSKSIASSPNALAYANRAMAYLKVNKYGEAEVDCTEALKLDGEYVKAYLRRATARKELGDLKGYVGDVESALKLNPDNQEIKKLHAEAKSLIKANSSGSLPTAPPVQNE